jgi:hypothetical protein
MPGSIMTGGLSLESRVQPQQREQPAGAAPAPRRYVLTFLATLLGGCLLLGGFNFVVNPLNFYPPRLVRPLTYGDQLTKVDLMNALTQKPEVLILGSSRTMKLAPADVTALTGLTAFNGGVSSSRPEEWYAMLSHAVDDLHWQPKELVVGVDMETLFYHGAPNDDLLSSGDLRPYLPLHWYLGSLEDRATLLFSYKQLKWSREALALQAGPRQPAAITFDADGLLHYVGWEKAVATGTYQLATDVNKRDYVNNRYGPLAGANGAATLDPERTALFEQMLKLATDHGVRVRLFTTTFHPSVLAALQPLPVFAQVHRDAVQYLTDAAARYPGVSFVDFTDLSAFGGDPDNFFDGVHIRQENGRKLLERLLRQ